MTAKEYLLQLLDLLEQVPKVEGFPNWRICELFDAREKMLEECTMALGAIVHQENYERNK